MSWVRIHDGAMGNLKIMRLRDSAFRLWIRGLCYCQTHLTDGLIPREALKFLDAKRPDVDQLASVLVEGKAPLWERVDAFGFKVHDYLDWNDSKETVEDKRNRARERAHVSRTSRTRHSARALHVASGVVNSSTPSSIQHVEGERERKPSRPSSLARRIFLHRWQIDALIDILGPHAATFELDAWLDALNTSIAGHVLPPDPWKFVQAELRAEIQRRGLSVAGERRQPVSVDWRDECAQVHPERCPNATWHAVQMQKAAKVSA